MTSRSWKNRPVCFCYICGEYKTVDNRKSIRDIVRKAYYACFRIKTRSPRQTMDSSCCLQDMCRTFETMDKWNQAVNGIWYTNGLEVDYKSC